MLHFEGKEVHGCKAAAVGLALAVALCVLAIVLPLMFFVIGLVMIPATLIAVGYRKVTGRWPKWFEFEVEHDE